MYYFALITSDFCKQAEVALISFFHYNDILLNLYVVDGGYDKVVAYFKNRYYSDKLNIISYYSKEFDEDVKQLPISDNKKKFPIKTQITTLYMFRILDEIKDDEIVRIDLDVMYFEKIDFTKYDHALSGTREISFDYPKEWHESKFQINIGVAKYIKSKFNLKNSFTDEMFRRLQADGEYYLIPDQDIINELTDDKFATPDYIITAGTHYDAGIRIHGLHFTSTCFKPWIIHSNDIDFFMNNNKGLFFIVYEHFARHTNIFIKEASTNVKLLKEYDPNRIYYTSLANKPEFDRLCKEIDSWRI